MNPFNLKQIPGITPKRTPAVIRDGVYSMNITPQPVNSSDSAATPLSNAQIDDLYYYVCQHGKMTDNDNRFFLAVAKTEEETAFFPDAPDYYSVFINEERWPVAAAAPMDNLYYLLG
ncbi:TPA: hypothetical protein LG948_004916 [Citrobacter freundii]|uniref:Uncharacterized protein n=2 Tax=Enterobacterales TaxID=91347 RepID=A0AAP9QIF0_CITFR|nr:hypothetical protein HV178_27470 [Citrobacter freundii]HAW7121537.1 hypothetical protein [Citrobacter freundii]HAW7139395.1 hypothetical protein [Citrobacter freundii]HAW7144454.1 hypothetical protein [Citrobacter freundii]HBK3073549.1 hypothetical protein [Citrobacter freundii]